MQMNTAMRSEYENAHKIHCTLPRELLNNVKEGFLKINNCIFLKHQYDLCKHVTQDDFPDEVGYECFVNHIHIDNYVNNNLLTVGILLLQELGNSWLSQDIEGVLRLILSIDETSCVVRCHLLRSDQLWLADDLESFQDAILFEDYSK
jgi:hypothetical protein